MVVVGAENVTLYNRDGVIIATDQTNLLTDPTFINGFADWDVVAFGPTPDGEAFPVPGTGVALRIIQGIGRDIAVRQDIVLPVAFATYRLKFKVRFLDAQVAGAARSGLLRIEVFETGDQLNVFVWL